jgi:hypothetical protein
MARSLQLFLKRAAFGAALCLASNSGEATGEACGLTPTPEQVAALRLQRHEILPEWNYTIKPQL